MYLGRQTQNRFKNRFIHNVKFTFTGCYTFINSLQDYLVEHLGFRKTKLNYSKAKNPNNNTSENVCTMEYSGKKQIENYIIIFMIMHLSTDLEKS